MHDLGSVIADIGGIRVDGSEHPLLRHPQLGGIILFSRNYESPAQLKSLCAEIRDVAGRDLLIAVDQEGGRVQRFRRGFTRLPPAGHCAEVYDQDPASGMQQVYDQAHTMATELRACTVDLSFAPVLDLDTGLCEGIGDRAVHSRPEAVTALARAFIDGMHAAGMAAVAKHFPGHGHVREDSHLETPVDSRSLEEIEGSDLVPFRALLTPCCEGVMTAHIQFPAVDDELPTYSPFWLKTVLRNSLEFEGVVFSDDLNMRGAYGVGGPAERARRALDAGCDALLICNNPGAAWEILDQTVFDSGASSRVSLGRMKSSNRG